MTGNLNVSVNPIQRNVNDIDLELSQVYLEREEDRSIENIQRIYSKF